MRTSEVTPVLAPPHRETDPTEPVQPAKRDPWLLDRRECLRLLGTEGIGRLILGTRLPPWTMPVAYTVEAGRIATEVPADAVAQGYWPGLITFEADHIDLATGAVWSVTVLGDSHVEPPAGSPEDADERRGVIVTVDTDLVTGRRYGAASTPADAEPGTSDARERSVN